jgi:hypothetical protein
VSSNFTSLGFLEVHEKRLLVLTSATSGTCPG